MNKFYIGLLLFLCATSYSQDKIEKGTYISTPTTQEMKLRLQDDHKYELVVFFGDYEMKNDTLYLKNNSTKTPEFLLSFSSEAKPSKGKIKVKFSRKYASYFSDHGFYIGTQIGNEKPSFQNLTELSDTINSTADKVEFEIPRADFIHLAREDYNKKTSFSKFAIPRDANEISVEYNNNYIGNVELQGYLDEKHQLVIIEKGKSDAGLVFIPESDGSKARAGIVQPIETKIEKNWTYPGKKNNDKFYQGTTTDRKTDFKLATYESLQKAQEATKKTPSKFLVVSYDPDNKNAKEEFAGFIQNQQHELVASRTYSTTNDYDTYNYYAATSKDKSWAAKNKITEAPSTIVMDANGTILSRTKGNIVSNQSLFSVYPGSAYEKLKKAKTLVALHKALDSKKEAEILKGFSSFSSETMEASMITLQDVNVTPAGEQPTGSSTTVPADTWSETVEETVYTMPSFDKKKVIAAWDNIVKNHSKDSKPNMEFTKTALEALQHHGFYIQLFGEKKTFGETDLKTVDYLLKHYDAILDNQAVADSVAANYTTNHYLSKIDYALPVAFYESIYAEDLALDQKKRLLEAYKKVMEKQSDNLENKLQYLGILNNFARNSGEEKEYIAEYDAFFRSELKDGQNIIERLDEIFNNMQIVYPGYGWQTLKSYFSNACNEAAWFVVEKSKNSEFVKKAIKWSESSLIIDKNNPYCLDTLAQLYYKNGEKQKAIATQEQALKFSSDILEETKVNMETVLEKMKNGTY